MLEEIKVGHKVDMVFCIPTDAMIKDAIVKRVPCQIEDCWHFEYKQESDGCTVKVHWRSGLVGDR